MTTKSKYQEELFKVRNYKCPECSGSGKCNDAELGDIEYNEWKCTDCSGTGFAGGIYTSNVLINKPPKKATDS